MIKSNSVERALHSWLPWCKAIDEGRQQVRGPLPAVLSVVKELNEPRYPSFMGIRKASRAEIPIWTTNDLGLDEIPAPAVTWPEIYAPPKVDTEVEIPQGWVRIEVHYAEGFVPEKKTDLCGYHLQGCTPRIEGRTFLNQKGNEWHVE